MQTWHRTAGKWHCQTSGLQITFPNNAGKDESCASFREDSMTLAAQMRWNRSMRAFARKPWVVRTRNGLAGSLTAGAVLGLCTSVWLAMASNGDDDDFPLIELFLIVTGISTIMCALIGTTAAVVASWIEPLRLRVLTLILASSLAAMVANRLFGYDFFEFPLESVPLLGGVIGAAVGVSLQRRSSPNWGANPQYATDHIT
jgi:hypothetical protein